jgi:hypothetical protein
MANDAAHRPTSDRREYMFRLHRSGRPWDKRPDEVDWEATAVGQPVKFIAVQFGASAWYAPGPVTVTAPEALENPAWTVQAADEATPTMTGQVGHRLVAGGRFDLPVTGMLVGAILRRGDAEAGRHEDG